MMDDFVRLLPNLSSGVVDPMGKLLCFLSCVFDAIVDAVGYFVQAMFHVLASLAAHVAKFIKNFFHFPSSLSDSIIDAFKGLAHLFLCIAQPSTEPFYDPLNGVITGRLSRQSPQEH